MIEASTAPEHLDEYLRRGHPAAARARRRPPTRSASSARATRSRCAACCAQEAPAQRLEAAALDLFALGRVRSRDELLDGIVAVGANEVREAFARMLGAGAAVALAGKIPRAAEERLAPLMVRRGN